MVLVTSSPLTDATVGHAGGFPRKAREKGGRRVPLGVVRNKIVGVLWGGTSYRNRSSGRRRVRAAVCGGLAASVAVAAAVARLTAAGPRRLVLLLLAFAARF